MKLGDWVKLTPPATVDGRLRSYGKMVGFDLEDRDLVTLQFPVQVCQGYRHFSGPAGVAPTEAFCLVYHRTKVEEVDQRYEARVDTASIVGPSIGGMPRCRSHSLESGGNSAFCTCDGCF